MPSDGGPDVVAPPGCDLTVSPKDSAACVDDSVGVFVSPSGDDGATGKKAAPLKSIGKAIEVAGARGLPRVYVCEGSYDTNVEIKAPVGIHGGFSCGWAYTGAKPKLAPPKGIALRVRGVGGAVVVEDIEVVGAADANTPGDSAIAAFVTDTPKVSFDRVNLSAGRGTAGAQGSPTANYVGAAAMKGGAATLALGGDGPTCACTDGATSSTGGHGGNTMGVGLTDGSAVPNVGVPNSGASKASSCDPGLPGANGTPGGTGTPMASPGALSSAGWSAQSTAKAAPPGKPAQGGGGGGTKLDSSAAGGGGGCGGCGGGGGTSGSPGGSSFALLVNESNVIVTGGALTTSAGGGGGTGGNGQDGQGGGTPGTGIACNGGPGGIGAGGSGGPGGPGGHSVPIAFAGTEPKVTNAMVTPGTKGASGPGGAAGAGTGNPGAAGPPGPEGKAQNTLAL